MKDKQTTYDYIIAGSGCAGLSLLYRMLKSKALNSKKILVIDKEEKSTNDRTWCFWEKSSGLFESIVTHQWNTLGFFGSDFSNQSDLKDYSYKMINGVDFYKFVLNFAKEFKNVSFSYENIQEIVTEGDRALLTTDQGTYTAEYVFNSTRLFYPEMSTENTLLQHFQGWVIETEDACFNSELATLMDFRLSQKNGATFMYVLPTSDKVALVEYTLFSEQVLAKESYQDALKDYISNYLKIKNYKITHKEFGVIPMSLAQFSRSPKDQKRIVSIGTAGGYTKASSGYTFQFIQKNTELIIDNLEKNIFPNPKMSFREKMFQWYDRTLIDVILSKKMEGKEIFSLMFKKLPTDKILAFLANESSLMDDIKIMSSLPIQPFISSGVRQLR